MTSKPNGPCDTLGRVRLQGAALEQPPTRPDIIRRFAHFSPIIVLALWLSSGRPGLYLVGGMLVFFAALIWWFGKSIAIEEDDEQL